MSDSESEVAEVKVDSNESSSSSRSSKEIIHPSPSDTKGNSDENNKPPVGIEEKEIISKKQKAKKCLIDNRGLIIRGLIILLIIIGVTVAVSVLIDNGLMDKVVAWVDSIGYVGLIMITAGLFISCTPIFSLYTVVTIVAGFLYNFWIAFGVSFPSAAVAALLGFGISKRFCNSYIQKELVNKTMVHFNKILENHAFKVMLLLRLSPLPFGVSTAIAANTKVPFWKYALASSFGLIPDIAISNFIGTTIKSITEAVSGGSGFTTPQIIILVVQIVATVSLVIGMAIIGRKAYKKVQDMEKDATENTKEDKEVNEKDGIALP